MLRRTLVLAVVVPVLSMLAVGCQDPEKVKLTNDNQRLTTDNANLKAQILQANEREAEINRELQSKDAQLSTKDAELAGLKQKLAEKGPAKEAGAPGWISTTFGDYQTIGSDLLFGSGKAVLTPKGKSTLDQVVKDLKTHYPGKTVQVFGHTDSDPIKKSDWDDNLELSANRAMAVTRYLKDHGINPAMVETIAMGEWHPEGKDKAKNRRVEIFVVKAKEVQK